MSSTELGRLLRPVEIRTGNCVEVGESVFRPAESMRVAKCEYGALRGVISKGPYEEPNPGKEIIVWEILAEDIEPSAAIYKDRRLLHTYFGERSHDAR